MAELRLPRTGYPDPIALAFAPLERAVAAACPAPPELRADPDAASERSGVLVAAAVGALVEALHPGPPERAGDLRLRAGRSDGALALVYPAPAGEERDAAELARWELEERLKRIDRLRCDVHVVPGHALDVEDLRAPIGAIHPLRVAEALARLGGMPADEDSLERHEDALLALLEPDGGAPARAHADPEPVRRVARRILQRLDGMGKWGGYHTAFDHLARGFAGNQRALAYEVGERLVEAGLLLEKPSVGQRHVLLNPRRRADIRALLEQGTLPPDLRLPEPG
ncbi:MAG: hypothetical protein ACM3UV_04570 [Nocardioidaceae bacterium]